MDDQQPGPGDLTEPAPGRSGEEAEASVRRATPVGKARRAVQRTVTEPADTARTHSDDGGDADATSRGEVAEHRSAGWWAPIVIGLAAAFFIGASAFCASAVQPYLAHRAEAQTELEVARTAENAITTLWTYTPDDMDTLSDRAARFLGGDFATEYRRYVDAIAPTNKQAQVSNNTEVVGAAVESLNGPDATAIVYTNSTAVSPLTNNIPSLRYLSYRLTMHREHGKWLITRMSNITSLDLTPQI